MSQTIPFFSTFSVESQQSITSWHLDNNIGINESLSNTNFTASTTTAQYVDFVTPAMILRNGSTFKFCQLGRLNKTKKNGEKFVAEVQPLLESHDGINNIHHRTTKFQFVKQNYSLTELSLHSANLTSQFRTAMFFVHR